MSALDEVIGTIRQVIDRIASAEGDAATAHTKAGEAVSAAHAFGADRAIQGTAAVQHGAEQLKSQLVAVKTSAEQLLQLAQQVKAGG